MSGGSHIPAPSDNWAGNDHGPKQTLGYATLAEGGRPGVLTTMGVLSIVFGSLGLLAALWQALSWGMYLMIFGNIAAAGGGGIGMPGGFTPAGTITQADAQVIADAVGTQITLNAADNARLAAALPLVDLPMNPPANNGAWTQAHVTGEISGTSTSTFGTASSKSITFSGGDIDIDATWITVSTWAGPNGFSTEMVDTTNIVTANNTAGMAVPGFGATQSKPLIYAGLAAELVLLGLAGMLLAAGIVALRGRPMARTLHLWWAPAKIVLSLTSGVLGMAWLTDLFTGMTNPGPGFSIGYAILLPHAFGILLGCAYPVAVLLMLRTRSMREYFA